MMALDFGKLPYLSREGVFDRATLKEEKRSVELSFSSEEPYDRWWGTEILSHEKSAVDLTRLSSGRANLLINHNANDWVGVVESARIDGDKKGRAVVRFGNSQRAKEIFQDVKDGILTSVSVGYRINEAVLSRMGEDGKPDEYTVTSWTPHEVSLVSVPADSSVGVGRAMEDDVKSGIKFAADAATQKGTEMEDANVAAVPAVVDQEDGAKLERLRITGIRELGNTYKLDKDTCEKWVSEGVSMNEAVRRALEAIAERSKAGNSVANIGMSKKETRQYSMLRAVNAVLTHNWNNAGLELEASKEVQKRTGKNINEHSFYVPLDIQQRDLTVGTTTAGGFLVETANQGFIDILRNRSVAMRMGATTLSGLQGNVSVPKQTAAATAVWLANEASTITESQQTFGQMNLTPKTVGAYTEISRLLLLQSSPSAESVVTSDLAAVTALAVDAAALSGTGASGQPTGITNTAGIGSVSGTTLGYAGIVEFQTDIAANNVMPARGGYVTTPAVAGLLKQRQRFTSTDTPLWQGNIWDGTIEGFPAMSSLQMAAATMLFGDWSAVVVGEWGVLEIEVNPFANFQAGIVGVRAMYTVDVGVRYPGAFSLATTIT